MSKCVKLQSSPSQLPVLPSNVHTLVSVQVVCRHRPEVLHLPHVEASLHEFLDWSREVPFTRACGSNFVYFVRRRLVEFNAEPEDSPIRYPDFRQWQFSEGVKKAVANDNLELVTLLSTHFISCYVPKEAIIVAASLNRVEILQWLVAHRNDTRWDGEVVAAAIAGNHFTLAKWLVERLGTTSVHELARWAEAAATTENLEMLKWVCSFSEEVNLLSGLWSAVDEGQLEVVKWILQQLDDEILTSPDFGINLNKACSKQHLAVLKWLVHFAPTKCFIVTADLQAAKRGHFDVVRLLHANNIRGCSRQVIKSAAFRGRLDIVKWLIRSKYQTIASGGAPIAMDSAAVNGHFDIVKWLHENTAKNGHLDVVKWLHGNRTEGCTTDAMNGAARNGHLDAVKWLDANRTEGCTTSAMGGAAMNQHRNVVEWLNCNRSEGGTAATMGSFATQGDIEAVYWCRYIGPGHCDYSVIQGAVQNGHFEIAWFLHQDRECNECDVIRVLRERANINRRWEFTEWLFLHHRNEFEQLANDIIRSI